jgi:hypothetical protein
MTLPLEKPPAGQEIVDKSAHYSPNSANNAENSPVIHKKQSFAGQAVIRQKPPKIRLQNRKKGL